jgi:tetratricopeptide (TPR) repeat protein
MKTLVYLADQKYEDCLVWCNKGLEQKPGDDDLLFNKSEAYVGLKNYDEARKALFQMLENNPNNTQAMRYVASSFMLQKIWDSAVVHFTKAIDIDPLDYMSYFDRGISKSYTQDLDGATEDITKAMQLDTASKFVGYNNLGFYLKLEKKDYAGAIDFFNKAIEQKPDFAYAYSNRGFAKLNLNDIKGAYQDLKKSIALDNSNSYAFKNMGLICLKDGKVKQACENFKKAIKLGYTERYDDEVDKLLAEHCK